MNNASLQTLFSVVSAIVLALSVGAILIMIAGSNPIDAYYALFSESFFNYWGISNTLVKTSPMLLAGLAVILPV